MTHEASQGFNASERYYVIRDRLMAKELQGKTCKWLKSWQICD